MTSGALKTFKSGEIIMRQGDTGKSAYIIENGHVQITIKPPDGLTHIIGTRGAGSIIGEMALVDNAPRTATITAIEDCALMEISKDDFTRRLDAADPVLRMTAQVILTRYRDMLARSTILREHREWRPPAETLELNQAGNANAIETIKMANEFRSALNNSELSLNYQPIVDLKSGKIAGLEALMRWHHPIRGNISPDIFIPLAEQSGDIVAASHWALRQSCGVINKIGGDDFFISVNFSTRDFAAADFAGTIQSIMNECKIAPPSVHIEITERLLMDQPGKARETLLACKNAGFLISIDDFGTGYSSLSYLHHFPIDILKIDRSFIREMMDNNRSMELVKAIIGLGKNLGMKIIAEGVEQPPQAETLKSLGCDMAQGYHFARPMTETDAIAHVHKKN
jgi:EAL domain-containing protein (putative c-di-GMP-specific phosphodiesterase class I)/CRP-like cAMP-binding protein